MMGHGGARVCTDSFLCCFHPSLVPQEATSVWGWGQPSPAHVHSCGKRRGLMTVVGVGQATDLCTRALVCDDKPTLCPPEAAVLVWRLPLWPFEVHILPIPAEMVLLALSTHCSLFFLSPFLCTEPLISVGG